RAYLVTGARPLGQPEAFLDHLAADVLRGDVVALEAPASELVPPGDPTCQRSRVRYERAAMNSMELSFSTACPGYLVVNDLWDPGWRAWLDGGGELPVLEANSAVRAVRVPAGEHRVVFRFLPRLALAGLAITLTAALLSLGLLLAPALLRRGRRAPGPRR